MLKEMSKNEMMMIDGGNAFTPKYGDLRDVPAAVNQAVRGFANTLVGDRNFQQALVGTGQMTYGIIKGNPVTVIGGWERIEGAAGY
ncbi:hypothetical protein CACET_c08300 [Clostridium aceticum]|uniref:Uncharacterized protein n=1 Tax=Clostridium aceticum TaxID=84022 RepID=A0A0D8I5A2_9CLOT|nr:hypothetical protein [Clostridium aceticum]AKL94339.1 hypothetical protein CACET_c08300 [Clostridium aceticum]KJF25413.1 hypothetical protein TZ02_18825 [Clostridium aceticum]